jgi:acyl carrier protein
MADVTLEGVKEMLLDALNLREDYDPEEVGDDMLLFGEEGLGLDSLDALQLAVALEERYGLTVDEDKGSKVFRSARTLHEFISAG